MLVDPSPETLSLFTVYMSHHINPCSVASYLSGISQQLEPYFPSICNSRRSPLVEQTLRGCMRLKGVATKLIITESYYEFHLPSHKADRFFEGNKIIVKQPQFSQINTLSYFKCYITNRDSLFPLSSPLWLTSNGSVPNRQFFISRLHGFFSHDERPSLTKHGVPPSIIQPMGRWSSDAFVIYIRKNPVLIQALLYSQQPH
ncbi:hypothetical protein BYT27DRAFT_7225334 [Phlegmacium glaucopus]|nr:hypothetical protein BYT27DRAFT_7225334 [Phlegmacium glaucopus]